MEKQTEWVLYPMGHRIMQVHVSSLEPGDDKLLAHLHVNLMSHRPVKLTKESGERWSRISQHQDTIWF